MPQVLDFITAPMNTDELKRQVEALRVRLEQKAAEEVQLSTDLSDVNLDLDRMEAKTNFLISMAGQLLELSMPPPAEGLEAAYDRRKATLHDPLILAAAGVGAAGLGIMALSGLVVPKTLKILGYVTGSARLSQAATAGKLAKIAKLGRASVYLAVGVSILDMVYRMTEAKKINDYLADKRDEFEAQVAEADRVLARYAVAIEQGQAYRQALLDGAGVANVNEYLGLLNEAIKDVAEQASTARMARNLLRMGQSPDQIAALLPGMDRAALDGIARRLAAEVALLEGKSPEEAARETGLTALQMTVVERVLAARGDAAIGHSDVEIAERHAIVISIADLQIDLVEAALPRIWPQLEGGGDLSLAAREALIPLAALEQLRHEIPVRGALWSGAAPEDLAEDLAARGGAVQADRIAELAREIETERAMAARSGLKGEALMIALRLPSEVVAEPAA